MLKNYSFWLILIFAALHLRQPYAADACNTILLVSSNSHFGMVHRIEAALYAHPTLDAKPIHIIAENVSGTTFSDLQKKSCLIVTIGTQALTNILKTNTSLPILSILSRKKSFEMLLKEHARRLEDPTHPLSAIYLDQPLDRQLNLVQCLLRNSESERTIGILLGINSYNEQEDLQKIARKKTLKLITVNVNNFENPVAVLDVLLDDVNIVLALPDTRIYNTKTTRGMLLTAFHKHVPIVGYSKTYVNHGALGAVYATTKQLADQTAAQILTILKNKDKPLPSPQYPKEFEVAINYHVAQTLGLEILDEATLKKALEDMEIKSNGQ